VLDLSRQSLLLEIFLPGERRTEARHGLAEIAGREWQTIAGIGVWRSPVGHARVIEVQRPQAQTLATATEHGHTGANLQKKSRPSKARLQARHPIRGLDVGVNQSYFQFDPTRAGSTSTAGWCRFSLTAH
jgi:hypothetical protein